MKTDGLFARFASSLPWLREGTILLASHGSQAYGTALPTSDHDYKGVAIPPAAYFHGFTRRFEQAEGRDPDLVIYDVRKFCGLAAACNPAIIEVLWVDEGDLALERPAGRLLREHRAAFLSRRVRHTFSGYALSQLQRIKTHRRWLLEPPAEGPSKEWAQYQTWKRERNAARAELEARFGYDTKHAMHLVRLMRMAGEILETGRVQVKRPDAAELLEVRAGRWSYDALVAWAEEADRALDAVTERSPLPHSPDVDALDALCQRLVEASLAGAPRLG